jgi:hypothetical protein
MMALGMVIAAVIGGLAALHVFWAFGGTLGTVAVLPTRDGVPLLRPTHAVTLAVAVGLAGASYVALAVVELVPWGLPRPALPSGCAVLAVLFGGRAIGELRYVGFFKRVRGTAFAWWDTRVFSPLCAALSTGYLLLWYRAW